MDPTVDYFHLGELTGSGDLAFNLCWRADTFVIFDKTTEHCPTEFIFGRLDHSPGFPTLPGQPGTVVTHNTEFEFSDEPFALGVLLPTLNSWHGLLWRYLGLFVFESRWNKLDIEEWNAFPEAVRHKIRHSLLAADCILG